MPQGGVYGMAFSYFSKGLFLFIFQPQMTRITQIFKGLRPRHYRTCVVMVMTEKLFIVHCQSSIVN